MNVCPDLGLVDGVEGGVSGFLSSFAPGVTAAPNGFPKSEPGVEGGDFDKAGDAFAEAGGVGLELEENLELMLDIQEFRRGSPAAF